HFLSGGSGLDGAEGGEGGGGAGGDGRLVLGPGVAVDPAPVGASDGAAAEPDGEVVGYFGGEPVGVGIGGAGGEESAVIFGEGGGVLPGHGCFDEEEAIGSAFFGAGREFAAFPVGEVGFQAGEGLEGFLRFR